jgi:hypothetical protein
MVRKFKNAVSPTYFIEYIGMGISEDRERNHPVPRETEEFCIQTGYLRIINLELPHLTDLLFCTLLFLHIHHS